MRKRMDGNARSALLRRTHKEMLMCLVPARADALDFADNAVAERPDAHGEDRTDDRLERQAGIGEIELLRLFNRTIARGGFVNAGEVGQNADLHAVEFCMGRLE